MFESLIAELQKLNTTFNSGVGKAYSIAQIDVQNPYKEFTETIQAGEIRQIFYAHDYFRLLEYTGTPNSLKVRFGSSGSETDFSGAGLGYKMLQAVDRVELRNTDAAPITVKIVLATGTVNDDRLNVSGTVNVNVTNTPLSVTETNPLTKINVSNAINGNQVSVGTGAQVLLSAANANKIGVTIGAGDTDLFIAETGVTTANSFKIPANTSMNITTNAAVFGIRSSGTFNAFILEETI